MGTGANYTSMMVKDGAPTQEKSSFGYNRLSPMTAYLSQTKSNEVAAVLDSGQAYWFGEASGNYDPLAGARQSLSFDASICRFVLASSNGDVRYFTPDGKLDQVIRADANGTQVTERNGQGQPTLMVESFDHDGQVVENRVAIAYNNAGLIETIASQRTKSPTVDIRRNAYAYYGPDEPNGNDGDLKTVTTQILSGTTWVDKDTTYYRYYKAGEANGFEHGLKFVLGPAAFVRLKEDPQVLDPLLASNAKVAQYADNYYEYNADHRATKSVVQAGLLTYTFSYTNSAHSDGFNHWKLKVITTRPDGSQLITYSNYFSQVLLTDLVAGSDHWIEYNQYDSDARKVLHAHPSAVVSYDDSAADLDVVLKADEGLIDLTTYYAITTATASVPGGAAGYVEFTKVQQGSAGDPIKLTETTYYERVAGAATIYPVAETTVFREEDGSGEITTSYAYTWFGATAQVQQRTTTLPVVPETQNGTGATETITEIFDVYGNRIWQRDARGFITYRVYDVALGVVIQEIRDVDGEEITLPAGWTTPVGGRLHLITDFEHDSLGRTTQSLGPVHNVNGQSVRTANWIVYRDLEGEVYSGQGYALGSSGQYQYTLINPVAIQRQADNGAYAESITAVRGCEFDADSCSCTHPDAGPIECSGRLSSSDCFPQTSWVRWSVNISNKHGQQAASRIYHRIPTCGAGSPGINYDETTYGYDLMNRQSRVVSAAGTISRAVYDVRSQAVSSWLGTDDTGATDNDPTGCGAPSNNMVQISVSQYDGGQAGGDGNLTQQTAIVNASTSRVTSFQYDFRNRRTVIDGEIDFFQQAFYDNLNQTIRIDRRDTSSGGNLIGRSETRFDNRGRAYRTSQYAVDPSTGVVGNSLVGNTYFDASDNVIESRPSGSEAFTKSAYDGIGRPTAQYVGYTESVSSSSSASGGSLQSGDVVFGQQETQYDAVGNVLLATSRQRFHDATGTGPLQGPVGGQPKSRDSYVAMWCDGVGRQIASANYGTNDNAGPPTRPDAPPESTDLILVSRIRYNVQGEAFESVDPAGMVNRTLADAAGRAVRMIQNYVPGDDGCCECAANDQNVTTERRYGSGGQLVQFIAKNAATGDQVTEYVYGVTLAESDLASNDLLYAEVYPDYTDADDREIYAYNRQGQRIRLQDPNGSIHEYEYDLLGRQSADKVTMLGSGVDDRVRRIGQSYEVRGLVEKITSYGDAEGTALVNQVQNVYNAFSQLKEQYQEHHGGVNTTTSPKIQYAYAAGLSNTIRQIGITYPNGRVLEYLYDDIAADKLSRIRTLRWGESEACRYSYLGVSTFVTIDYVEPQVSLNYTQGGDENPYTGFDRFGRVINLLWTKYGTSCSSTSSSSGGMANGLMHLKYGYDRTGNRTYFEDLLAQTYGKDFDELYEYDGMQRLKKFHRGRLTDDNRTIVNLKFQQGWVLDATGNWNTFTQNDQSDCSQALDQQRHANRGNETVQITRTVGIAWSTPKYDRNGNMTDIPQPEQPTQSYQVTWDAWNRMVLASDITSGLKSFKSEYFGNSFRSVTTSLVDGISTSSRLLYSNRWQVLMQTDDLQDETTEYIWGHRYDDDIVCRYQHNTSGKYALADAGRNVRAIILPNASVAERYQYQPYGGMRVLTDEYDSSDYATTAQWEFGFGSYFRDSATGFILARARFYNTSIGMWISRDPIVARDDYNRYLYCAANPVKYVDPYGLNPGLHSFSDLLRAASQFNNSLLQTTAKAEGGPRKGESTKIGICVRPIRNGLVGAHIYFKVDYGEPGTIEEIISWGGGPGEPTDECKKKGCKNQLRTAFLPFTKGNPEFPRDAEEAGKHICEYFTIAKSPKEMDECLARIAKRISNCCIPYSAVPNALGSAKGCNSNCLAGWLASSCFQPVLEGGKIGLPADRPGPSPGWGAKAPDCLVEKPSEDAVPPSAPAKDCCGT